MLQGHAMRPMRNPYEAQAIKSNGQPLSLQGKIQNASEFTPTSFATV